MSSNSENITAAAADATSDKVVKAFLVGHCALTMSPIFAEAAVKDDGTVRLPSMDDSREGLRFVMRNGQENGRIIPVMTICYPGAITEIKKYLYDVDVTWAPQGVDKSQLTRDRPRKGPVEEGLENFVRSNGARPSIFLATNFHA